MPNEELKKLEEALEKERLVKFALAALDEHRENFSDLDGGWIQDKAKELGILVQVNVTEPCGEYCFCAEWDDFPQTCLRYSEAVRALKQHAGEDGETKI